MARMKRGALVASTLMLVAIIASACNQPYSSAPVVTNTPIDPNSLFATPIGGATQMSDVQIFATQTAQAANPGAVVTPSATATGVAPQNPTFTSTPFVSLPNNPTLTPTATLAVPGGATITPIPGGPTITLVPSGTRPLTYTLQKEEFPYCIARRFNINPQALMDASGITNPDIYFAGLQLTIPVIPPPNDPRYPLLIWGPGPRALRPHPAPYTVTGNADTTVYGVACKFGDVEPSAIVQVPSNAGITLNSVLNVGQSLSIP